MRSKRINDNQSQFLMPTLKEQLNPQEGLYMLADVLPWANLEEELSVYYQSEKGRPAKPIRLMVGLHILKYLFNLSDESVVNQWVQNPYFQFFCGEEIFQWKLPVDPSDLCYFRKRLGEEGMQRIMKASVDLHEDRISEKEVLLDTTAQEKNITYPTDAKLYHKVALKASKIAKKNSIQLKRTYAKRMKMYMRLQYNLKSNRKARIKAVKHMKVLAARVVRDMERKMSPMLLESYKQELSLFHKVLTQKAGGSDHVYSLHEPHVACIVKGKAHKKYEFGSKAALAVTKTSGVIVGVVNFTGNPHDSKTIQATLESVVTATNRRPAIAIGDGAYTGCRYYANTEIINPRSIPKSNTRELRKQNILRIKRRSSIESVFSHLKSGFRLGRNFLKGILGDVINLLAAATAYNIKKWLNLQLAKQSAV